jgi:hypothetical protein
LTKSAFRNRGLEVVVDTTKQAEFDFASHQLTSDQQETIAANLREVPNSVRDTCIGDIRIREVFTDWEVAFVVALDDSEVVILIIGLETTGQFESQLGLLARAASDSLPPGIQTLLKGRTRKK